MDEFQREVMQSIKAMFDLTARIDERMKFLTTQTKEQETKLDEVCKLQGIISSKLHVIESHTLAGLNSDLSETEDSINILERSVAKFDDRLKNIENVNQNSQKRWKVVFDFTYKTIWTLFVCWLLYKTNLQSPPLP